MELEKLTKKLYKWKEITDTQLDFNPILENPKDSIYVGLDLDYHKKRMQKLKETDLFTEQFIQNYNRIALDIDKKIKNKSLVYYVGDLPPFGNGADPWCNCQDYPTNYWEMITLENLILNNDEASFTWTWGHDFTYKIGAMKENKTWRISYLEGFEDYIFQLKNENN